MKALLRFLEKRGVIRSLMLLMKRYLCFGLVGASGIAVDMTVLFVLADPGMLALNLSCSKALAAETAIIGNFTLNELWTFRDLAVDRSWTARVTRFGRFNLICLAGIGLSVLLLNMQTGYFQMNMYLGNLFAILIVSFWNFGMNLKFGWNKKTNL